MTLPEKSDWMDDVVFAELDEEATKEQVKKYNEAGKAAGYGTEKRFRGDRFHGRSKSVFFIFTLSILSVLLSPIPPPLSLSDLFFVLSLLSLSLLYVIFQYFALLYSSDVLFCLLYFFYSSVFFSAFF